MDEVEQAQLEEQLRAAQQQRFEACQAEIEQVLNKYKCVLTGAPQFVQAGNGAWVISVSVGIALAK